MFSLTRTPIGNRPSNLENPNGGAVQYVETRYSSTGPQEWIIAPDAGRFAVTLFFPNNDGSAWIEGSDEPPSDLLNQSPANPVPPYIPAYHYYPITETVTDTTRVIVECCTAIRVNVVGGTVDVTVRC